MNFDNWDQIFMTNKQCLDMFEFVDTSNRESVEAMTNYDHYPLRRFMLTIPNGSANDPEGKESRSVFHHCFTFAGDHLDIRTIVEYPLMVLGGEEAFWCSIDMSKFILLKKGGPASEKLSEKLFDRGLEYWAWLMFEFMFINTYILSDPEKTTNVEEKVVKKQLPPGIKPNRSKKGPRHVRIVRNYTLKKNWKRVVKKRVQEISCPAWGVRGHFRHYKSGKTVFIQPYVKGKKRDEYKGKVYDLFKKEEVQ